MILPENHTKHMRTRTALPWCLGALVPGRASGAVTLKKLECSKQAYALYTLAWDNIIGFRSLVPWCLGALVPWRHGAMVPWCLGAMAPRCLGAMVPWCQAALVPRCMDIQLDKDTTMAVHYTSVGVRHWRRLQHCTRRSQKPLIVSCLQAPMLFSALR
ncbi:hypothetical protein CQW23_35331 [Capsicum baccatum]|uniref:Uncharacterized protein n=1 Tax=Capsicum baccatum TaxID=33114 RepID=A0A2G2UWL2_CAPBA|nr:hypothetical protein CQW23_35331 [Capsicum baccatum]